MRILFIYESIAKVGGGSQIATLTWMKNLKKMNLKVKLLCGRKNLCLPLPLKTEDLIINGAYNLDRIFPELYFSPILSKKAKRAILNFKPDLIQFNEPSPLAYWILQLACKHNVPSLYFYHTNVAKVRISCFPLFLFVGPNRPLNKLLYNYQTFLTKKAYYVACASRPQHDELKRRINKQIYVISYPIPDHFYQSGRLKKRAFTKLITISRLSGEKNIGRIIEMMSYLKNRFALTVVGDGVDRKHLEKKVRKMHLNKVVKFTGWVENRKIPKLLTNHDLFVSMSDFETFGVTYIEALACGLPIMVYDYPVSREVIPKNMAVFVNSLNPRIWSKKLIKLQKNPQRCYRQLRKNIDKDYAKLKIYHETESTKRLIEIYRRIINTQ